MRTRKAKLQIQLRDNKGGGGTQASPFGPYYYLYIKFGTSLNLSGVFIGTKIKFPLLILKDGKWRKFKLTP